MTTGSSAFRTVRLLAVVVSPLVLGATLLLVGTATPGYRPWADAFSRLASYDEPYAVLTRIAFVVYGLLVVVGAGPVGERVASAPRALALLVAGYGLAAVVAGVAPKDPPRAPHTTASAIHVGATIVGGACVLAAMAWCSRRAPNRTDGRVAAYAFCVTAGAAAVFPFVWGSRIYGVLELLMLATASGWLAGLALRLVLDPRSRRVVTT